MKYLLGADIGTTSIKACVFDEEGNLKKSVTKDYTLIVNGDRVEFPADEYFRLFTEAYLELNKKSPNMYKVSKAAEEDDCQYILLKDEVYWPKVPLTQLGFEEHGRFGEWILYKSQREVNE